jgi:hypothetical protein
MVVTGSGPQPSDLRRLELNGQVWRDTKLPALGGDLGECCFLGVCGSPAMHWYPGTRWTRANIRDLELHGGLSPICPEYRNHRSWLVKN